MPSRRSLLAGTASLLAAGAGCTGVLDESPPDPVLRDVTLRNTDDEAHALAVRLSREGEVVLDETYELGPRSDDEGETVSDEAGKTTDENSTAADDVPDHLAAITDAWDSPRGRFTATVRVDDRDPVEFRLDDGFGPGVTYRYEVRIEEDGSISTWSTVLDSTATTA